MSKFICIFACIFSMCVKQPAHVTAGDRTVEMYAETIKENDLKVLAVGGFYFKNKVEKLYLDLEYKSVLSDEDAHQKLTSYISGLVFSINKDLLLRPHLIKESFSQEDVSVSLSYLSEAGETLQVHLYNGEIVFSLYEGANNLLIKKRSVPFRSL
ncbi:MAG: hypothetical protein SP4CHLAM5_04770 [Chlamydiia bacterium]|nr:hypothetical protein [Chlamydiia bacterium]MCH9618348.1 hypothetical protein [Chlamydiia bacterium]